jgi:hypothetical protein
MAHAAHGACGAYGMMTPGTRHTGTFRICPFAQAQKHVIMIDK